MNVAITLRSENRLLRTGIERLPYHPEYAMRSSVRSEKGT